MILGKRLNLWAIERSDLMQNFAWANDPETNKLIGMNPAPRSTWDMERWYEGLLTGQHVNQCYAIKLPDTTYIGNVELSNIDIRNRNAEIGIMIAERDYRHQGYAKEAIILLMRYGFEEMGLHRIDARVLSFNEAAKKVFESIGFNHEGEKRQAFLSWGKFWDINIYSMLENEFNEKYPYVPWENDKR